MVEIEIKFKRPKNNQELIFTIEKRPYNQKLKPFMEITTGEIKIVFKITT